MSRRSVVVLAAGAALLGLSTSPAMADPAPGNASCVGTGASTWAKAPPFGFDNFGQFTSSSVDLFPDPGISGFVTSYAHLKNCPLP